MKLFIVESPSKCSKLKAILGAEYKVMPSVGHVGQKSILLKENVANTLNNPTLSFKNVCEGKMILEKGNFKYRDIVTKVCDDCGVGKKSRYGSVMDARKKRNSSQDYCKSCVYSHRDMPEQPKMSESPSWNGGRYENENGYYRVYQGEGVYTYEHKVVMERVMGRRLKLSEKVHHIDLNKSNNNTNNLYLFSSCREHALCHVSLQNAACSFLNKKIRFDSESNLYTLGGSKTASLNLELDEEVNRILSLKAYCEQRRAGGKKYSRTTVGKRLVHVLIAEYVLGRKLNYGEVVHHIDCNSLNNNPNNLKVMTRKEHSLCHSSLEKMGRHLFDQNDIRFKNGAYHV